MQPARTSREQQPQRLIWLFLSYSAQAYLLHDHGDDMKTHDDVIKWKHLTRYWPFVRRIHRIPVNSPHKGQWRGAWMLSLNMRLIKRLSKQSRDWWFETISRSLWRHCNGLQHDWPFCPLVSGGLPVDRDSNVDFVFSSCWSEQMLNKHSSWLLFETAWRPCDVNVICLWRKLCDLISLPQALVNIHSKRHQLNYFYGWLSIYIILIRIGHVRIYCWLSLKRDI